MCKLKPDPKRAEAERYLEVMRAKLRERVPKGAQKVETPEAQKAEKTLVSTNSKPGGERREERREKRGERREERGEERGERREERGER